MQPLIWPTPGVVTLGSTVLAPAGAEGPYTYSATQVDVFSDCARKWAFTYVDQVPYQPNRSAAYGTATHTQLERYLKGEPLDFSHTQPNRLFPFTWSDAAKTAQTAIPFLPAPRTVEVEGKFKGARLSDAPHMWSGIIDWRQLHVAGFNGRPLVIGDHKTTRDAKYALTSDALTTNIQSTIYARRSFLEFPHLSHIQLQWTYMLTQKRHAWPVYAKLSRDANESAFAAVDAVAVRMTEMRTRLRVAAEYPYDVKACDKYGGCPHRDRCVIPVEERLAQMGNGPSLFGQYAAPQGAQQAPAYAGYAPQGQTPPAPFGQPQGAPTHAAPGALAWPGAAPPAQPAAPSDADMREASVKYRDEHGRLRCDLQGNVLDPHTTETQCVRTSQGVEQIDPLNAEKCAMLSQQAQAWAAYSKANPAEAAKLTAAIPATPERKGVWTATAAQGVAQVAPTPVTTLQAPPAAPQWSPGIAAQVAGQINPPESAQAPSSQAFAAAQEAAKAEPAKKKGRPTNAEIAARAQTQAPPQAQAWQGAQAQAQPSQTPAPQAAQSGAEGASGVLTLYVDCYPSQGVEAQPTDASALYGKAHEILASQGIADYASVDYGKGHAHYACVVEELLGRALSAGDLALTVASGARESGVCLTRMLARATYVIRGTK